MPGSDTPCTDSSSTATFESQADRVIVSKGEFGKEVALSAIATFRSEAQFANAVRQAVPRKYCLMSSKRQTPCYELDGYIVFVV